MPKISIRMTFCGKHRTLSRKGRLRVFAPRQTGDILELNSRKANRSSRLFLTRFRLIICAACRSLLFPASAERHNSLMLSFIPRSENSWMFRRMRDSLTSTLSHPLPVERVRELDAWSKSKEYRALLTGGTDLGVIMDQKSA